VRVTIWGCRGSLAAPGPETIGFGGNTSCVEVRLEDGTLLVLDAGTGIRPLGQHLTGTEDRIHLLLTHLHLDHLEGLGFFLPVWELGREVHVWGPPSPVRTLEDRIARYFSPPLFPVDINDIPARVTFHDVPPEPWELGSATIEANHVTHPGPTVGFRITENGASLTYIPDHEPDLGGQLESLPDEWISGFGIASGTDLLFHDSQYFESEYAERGGWGHSSVAAAVTFARRTRVRRLVLFHHDPLHTDDDLLQLGDRAQELWGDNGTAPVLAREGMTINLSAAESLQHRPRDAGSQGV
jgi:phosphoribosyl 1,2-cyclic phosphodiesterase